MKKRFPVLRQKPIFALNLAEMLKEAIINFFLIDHLYSLIMWQYIEINSLCKHRKKKKSFLYR